VELLQSDLAVFAMLAAGVIATGLAIAADYAPELRRRRASKTERLR
jgi:hypothetical protein